MGVRQEEIEMAPSEVWIAWIVGWFIISLLAGLITGPILKRMSAKYPVVERNKPC